MPILEHHTCRGVTSFRDVETGLDLHIRRVGATPYFCTWWKKTYIDNSKRNSIISVNPDRAIVLCFSEFEHNTTFLCNTSSLCYRSFIFCGPATQRGSWPPHSWGILDHIQRSITVSRTPLDEWSVRRRDLYLTTHNTHNRQTSMPPVGIRTHDLNRQAAADLRLRPRGHWNRLMQPLDRTDSVNDVI